MKIFLDTNVYICFLLSKSQETAFDLIKKLILQGKLELFICKHLIKELETTVITKKYLSKNISKTAIEDFIINLKAISTPIPSIKYKDFIGFTRNPKDDYLIAYSLYANVDYLISLDKDLLVLDKIDCLKIIHSKVFVKIAKGII